MSCQFRPDLRNWKTLFLNFLQICELKRKNFHVGLDFQNGKKWSLPVGEKGGVWGGCGGGRYRFADFGVPNGCWGGAKNTESSCCKKCVLPAREPNFVVFVVSREAGLKRAMCKKTLQIPWKTGLETCFHATFALWCRFFVLHSPKTAQHSPKIGQHRHRTQERPT